MENKLKIQLPKKNQWILLLLAGILIVIIAIPTNTSTTERNSIYMDESEWDTNGLESRLENILTQMENVGKVEVMITYKSDDTVEGIVVLADGGKDPIVVRNITDVVQALFHVETHKIKVITRNYKK